jgi:hypothetical protein
VTRRELKSLAVGKKSIIFDILKSWKKTKRDSRRA